jgi:hypothetical protein
MQIKVTWYQSIIINAGTPMQEITNLSKEEIKARHRNPPANQAGENGLTKPRTFRKSDFMLLRD